MSAKMVEMNIQIKNSFTAEPTHKAVGTFGSLTSVTDEDKAFIVREPQILREYLGEPEPLVVILGWAGATHKNVSKYAELYRGLGCSSLQYILPTRFIFRHSDQVPEAMEGVATYLGQRPASTPVLIHCLSDTGCMSFQGLTIASALRGSHLRPRGLVWDSCPGPRPLVTIPRGLVLCAINWLSRMRDGMSMAEAVTSSADDFKVLAWRNYVRRLEGEEALISTMDNTWTGHWARDLDCHLPELFLYSKSDIYTSYKHLESEVIPARRDRAQSLTVKRWDKSPHVSHLRAHRREYEQTIEQFLHQCCRLQDKSSKH